MRNELRHHRNRLGLTQARLAELADCQIRTIQNLEYGHTNPTVPLARRLAGVLGCGIEEIFPPTEEEIDRIELTKHIAKLRERQSSKAGG